MTDDELMFARNKVRREGNRALALKIMRKIREEDSRRMNFYMGGEEDEIY